VQIFTVTVNPTPRILIVANTTQCDSTTTSILLQSPSAFTSGFVTFNLTATAPEGLEGYTESATGLLNGYTIEDKLINTGDEPLTVTYRAVPVSPFACNHGPAQIFTVTVNPTPRIIPVEDIIQCDSTTTGIVLQSPSTFTSGTVSINYTATAPVGLSGYSPGGTGLDNGYVIEDKLINETDGPLSVTYRVIPVSPGTCSNGPVQIFTVTVNPTPRIFPLPLSPTVQCDSTATGILLQSPSTFTDGEISFKYTVTATGGVTGFNTMVSGAPNDHIIADTLVNPTDIPQTVTYVITPVSPLGCNDGPSQSVIVIVNPTPRIFPVLEDLIQCDSTTTSITVLSLSTFTTGLIRFNFTATAPAGLEGYTPDAQGLHNGDIIEDRLINLTDGPLSVTYRVVPLSPLGCNAGPVQVFTVTVNPTPRIFPVPPDIIQCDSAITSILLRSPSTFTDGLIAFRYTVTATGGVTGFTTPQSGLSNNHVIDDRLVNPTDEPQTVTYTIYPISPLGCNEGPRQIITVRINPTPRFYVTAVADTLCNNETSVFTVTTPTTLTAGNVYFNYTIAEVSGDLAVISGYTTAAGVVITGAGPVTFTQTLINHSDAVQWVKFRLHPYARNTGGGDCDHGSARDTIITLLVEPTAKVNGVINNDTICNNSPVTYTLETPTTAIYGVRFNVRVVNPWPEITGADDRDDLPDLSIINETLNNDGDTARMIMYVITPATLAKTGAQKCIGINDTIRLWVNPTPRVIPINAFPAICYGDLTRITLTSPTVMTKGEIRFDFSVTSSGVPGDITGHFVPGTDIMQGDIISYRYRNYYDSVLSVYFAITPKAPGLTCLPGDIDIQEVQVHPKPNRGIQILKPLTCDVGSGLATIRAVISRGADPYHLVWDGPVGYHSEDLVEIHNLYGGQYTLRVTDNLNCTGDTLINVIPLTARPQLFAFPILTDIHVSCPGGSDGTIRIYVSSGITAPYRYWVVRNLTDTLYTGILMNNYNPLDPTTYRIYTGLPAGEYLLIIRDIHDCEVTRPAELIDPDPVEVQFGMSDFNGYNVPCRGYSNGSVWVESITGGTGSYIYEWFPENGLLSVSTNEPLLDSIPAGKYYLRITDLLGCVKLDSVTLIEPDGMQLTGSELSVSPDGNYNVSCNGISDGYIKLSITGGSGNFTYSWTGPDGYTASSRDISGLRAGTYTSTITDKNGCILLIPPTDSLPAFVLTEPEALNIDAVTPVSADGDYNIDCYGGSGTIDITITGGSEGTYSYNWSTYDGSGIVDGAEDQWNLTAGTYHLVVSDLNGCTEERYITLTQPNILIPNFHPTHITCASTSFDNGSIHLNIIGGIGPYSILWSTGETTEDISDLTEGNYIVTITDMNGCQIIDSVRIELPPPLTFDKRLSDYNAFNISCYGRSDGSIQITPTSGLPPYSYTWQGPDGFVAYSPEIFGLKAGRYILYIRDNNICEVTDTIDLYQPGRLGMTLDRSVSTAGGYNINCAGSATGSVTVTAVNNAGPVQYIWSDGTLGNVRDNLTAGNYKVIITDSNNCHADSAFILTQPDSIKLSFEVTPAFCPDMPDGAIELTVTGGVALSDYSYLWSDNSTGNGLEGLTKGSYDVKVTDDNGCSTGASVIVEAANPICLVIPNGISPNNDGINDVWNIGLIDLYPQVEVSIFNRWGELIWKSEKGYPKPWDGRSRGSVLPIDSYHYIIDLNDGSRQIIGNITIVK
jgi:gliding motility-associated-like protein